MNIADPDLVIARTLWFSGYNNLISTIPRYQAIIKEVKDTNEKINFLEKYLTKLKHNDNM